MGGPCWWCVVSAVALGLALPGTAAQASTQAPETTAALPVANQCTKNVCVASGDAVAKPFCARDKRANGASAVIQFTSLCHVDLYRCSLDPRFSFCVFFFVQ